MSCVFSRFNGILQLARQLLVALNSIYLIIIATVIFSLTLCFILFSIALKNRNRPFYFASFLYISSFFSFSSLYAILSFTLNITIASLYFLFCCICRSFLNCTTNRIALKSDDERERKRGKVRVFINMKQSEKRNYYRYNNNQREEEKSKDQGLFQYLKERIKQCSQ